MPASLRPSLRRSAAEVQSLGLEDELSFGSDEDLMETIGEIDVPGVAAPGLTPVTSRGSTLPPPVSSSGSSVHKGRSKTSKPSRSFKPSKDSVRVRKDSQSSLASSTHLLPPLPPVPSGSMLDLPSDMFGDRNGTKRGSLMGAFKVRGLRKWRDDQSSKMSFVTDTHSQASTLSLSKMNSNSSSRPSISSSVAYTPVVNSPASIMAPHLSLPPFDAKNHYDYDTKQPLPPSVRDIFPEKEKATVKPAPVTPAAPVVSAWGPTDISSAILPTFPASVGALEPITVLSVQGAKRPPTSILSARGDRSIRNAAGVRWTPCTIVFTSFKVSVSGQPTDDDERTVAHVHVFSSLRQSPTQAAVPSLRRSRSITGTYDPSAPRVEVERRALCRMSTASIAEDYMDADGRASVLRVVFGDEDRTKAGDEWLLEMKDARELTEWIRHVKKTAILINAEELGYGPAIRSAYENQSLTAEDLAQKLSAHARAAADARGLKPKEVKAEVKPTDGGLNRAQSAEEIAKNASLGGIQHRKSFSEAPLPAGGEEPDSIGSAAGLTLSGLSLSDSFAFPAPPSDLPSFPAPPTDLPSFPLPPTSAPSLPAFPAPPSDLPVRRPAPAPPTKPPTAAELFAKSVSSTSPPKLPCPVNGHDADDEEEEVPVTRAVRAPTPPLRRSPPAEGAEPPKPAAVSVLQAKAKAQATPSIASTANGSQTSGTSRLRRLRGKPQVIDIMAEFSQFEADNTPVAEDEEPIRDDRERRIRFAEE
ncbi:hypothetical protein Q8F55_004144 [Vanrija albida]|uniref:PH domain-containing protein n=1 Tax=Vanrija albida TaxID=181172 RepID=A0ABR3Q5Y3_9TREE